MATDHTLALINCGVIRLDMLISHVRTIRFRISFGYCHKEREGALLATVTRKWEKSFLLFKGHIVRTKSFFGSLCAEDACATR